MVQNTKLEAVEALRQEERTEAETSLQITVGGLKDQLKSHVDSLGILVEEKSSLEKSVQLHKKHLQEKEGKFA